MKTYIYGKFTSDTVPYMESNEFHTLSMFLGAYLSYCQTANSDYNTFKDFAEKNKLLYKDNQGIYYWTYINKAHAFIRDRINGNVSNQSKTYISKRQIRKLGFSGLGSVRMYPLNGDSIQKEMFDFVFGKENLIQVRDLFLDYISEKWAQEKYLHSYLTQNSGDSAKINTFRIFISFQYELLYQSAKGRRIIVKLSENTTYDVIQNELDGKGESFCQEVKHILLTK